MKTLKLLTVLLIVSITISSCGSYVDYCKGMDNPSGKRR